MNIFVFRSITIFFQGDRQVTYVPVIFISIVFSVYFTEIYSFSVIFFSDRFSVGAILHSGSGGSAPALYTLHTMGVLHAQ